jgi:hypothetical protein
MATKIVITRAQIEACHPCDFKFIENNPNWNGQALVCNNVEAELARLAALPNTMEILWFGKSGLLPGFTMADAVAAINKARGIK